MAKEETWEPIDSLGVTGEVVARNIRRIRKIRNLAYTEFSEQLARLGRPIPTLGLRKIESGGRRVDVDDLAAIAVVLSVSPVTLMMPARTDDGSVVQAGDLVPITGWSKPITASLVWDWLCGDRPLIATSASNADHILDPYRFGPTLDRMRFGEIAWPDWVYRDEVESFEILRQRLHEQGQAELTGKARTRKRASQILSEIRAERGEG